MRSLSLIVPLLLVGASVIAGCIGPESTPQSNPAPRQPVIYRAAPSWDPNELNKTLSQIRFDLTDLVKEDFFHTAHDGVQLHTRLYRPKNPGDWKAPVILHMSPYFGPNNAVHGPVPMNPQGLDGWLITHFLPRGYAVALNDVRGTGESGGCLDQTGSRQTRDGYRVVEDLATQPWSNGRVAMIGISYDGETQQSTATAAPPHLTTIVPLASVAGQYEWNFYDGVPYTTNGIGGMVSYATIGIRPGNPGVGAVQPGSGAKTTNAAERFDCHPEHIKEGGDPRGDFNAYWKEREIRKDVNKIKNTSVLYVHGLQDWNVKPNHIRDWYNDIETSKHAWLGQWAHNFPDRNSFKRDWSRTDWRLTVHRWFDHWLLDLPTGIMEDPDVQVQDSLGRWRFEDAWPPHNLPTTTYYLAGGGTLATAPGTGTTSYQDASVEMYRDPRFHAVFTSEPLAADLHYAGWPVLNFTASLDRPGTHFAVHLVDVGANGVATIINRGYLDAQHRNGLETSVPVPLNQPIKYSVRFFPQDDVIQAGHRLRIVMGAMDSWIQPDGTNARVELTLGPEARLMLPIVDDATARFFQPLVIETPAPPS